LKVLTWSATRGNQAALNTRFCDNK
jgi:hypothetical protein